MAPFVSDKRFHLICAPTGFGKSPTYIASALLNEGRTCILTSTKGLQEQLIKDFREVGLVDVRGMNSYPCIAWEDFNLTRDTKCNNGPCHARIPCKHKNGGCLYYDAFRAACGSRIIITNYSYYMHINRFSEGLGNFSLLILDEAHDAPDELSSFASVVLDTADLGALLDDGRHPEPKRATYGEWRKWAIDGAAVCDNRFNQSSDRIRDAAERGRSIPQHVLYRVGQLKQLKRKLDTVATMSGEWCISREGRELKFEPVWPRQFAEPFLFRSTEKVVLYSATIRPKTAHLLGIGLDQFEFHDYPSSFPVERRPVIHVPTISVVHSTSDEEYEQWVNRVDQIIRQRLDRKGIIHTTSYARRDVLVNSSEFRGKMLWHGSDETAATVEKFRRSPSPLILVSPSLTTGWDFPYADCQYQIIGKVPFPDFTSIIAKAREKVDPGYGKYVAAQTLVQTTGRGMRAADDQCETIIIDDNVAWFVRRDREYFPSWWLDSYRQSATIPKPLPLLQRDSGA